ncbi:MAG: iron-containing alcohol dehydrogenase [Rhizobiaceae bacterium]|nr:iron-containing alcohol dehydrogenase [Rhizobiaceae bacterium]
MCSLTSPRRVVIIASGTLARTTDEVRKLRDALGPKCAGVSDRMGAHVPRSDVIAATEMARQAQADLIVTLGGGSPTDGAKAVVLCLANGTRAKGREHGRRARRRCALDGAGSGQGDTRSPGRSCGGQN